MANIWNWNATFWMVNFCWSHCAAYLKHFSNFLQSKSSAANFDTPVTDFLKVFDRNRVFSSSSWLCVSSWKVFFFLFLSQSNGSSSIRHDLSIILCACHLDEWPSSRLTTTVKAFSCTKVNLDLSSAWGSLHDYYLALVASQQWNCVAAF